MKRRTKQIAGAVGLVVLLAALGIGAAVKRADDRDAVTRNTDRTIAARAAEAKGQEKKGPDAVAQKKQGKSASRQAGQPEGKDAGTKASGKQDAGAVGRDADRQQKEKQEIKAGQKQEVPVKKPDAGKPSASQPSAVKPPTSKPSSSQPEPAKPSAPAHTHSWVEQKRTVHHDATGHNEQVLVRDAWTEEIPVYEEIVVEVCNTCGAEITNNRREHIKAHALAGESGSSRTEYVPKQTGTKTVSHAAEYTTQWVQDSAAWDETVTTGYECSCGAVK